MKRTALALTLVLAAGCGAPWATARGAITGLEAGLEAVPDDVVPDAHRDDWAAAREATGAALDLGRLACDVWEREATRDAPTGWSKWVTDALRASARIVVIVKAAGVPIPAALHTALALLAGLGGLFL